MTHLALTVWQPWAWLIVQGYKDVENRPWATAHRGTLLIHAGRRFDPDFDWEWVQALLRRDYNAVMPSDPTAYPLGGIVGRVEVVACARRGERVDNWTPGRGFIEDSPWFTGPLGWALRRAQARAWTPCRGQQGLFRPDYGAAVYPRAAARKRGRG
jgi:hypothetical protein